MKYPKLGELPTSRLMTSVFYGYDHRLISRDGAFYDTKNLTTDAYPMLSVRKQRGTVSTLTKPGGLIEKDALCYVDNGKLYINKLEVMSGLSTAAGQEEKQLVSMGAYICIFPDKKYINTEDTTDQGSMEASWESTNNANITYAPCRSDGSAFNGVYVGADEPSSASYELWIDTGNGGGVAMSWSVSYGGWVQLDTVYTKITFTTHGEVPALFKEYDGVTISGSDKDDLNGSKVIYALGGGNATGALVNDWIVVIGLPDNFTTQSSGKISLSRSLPDMDFVCEAKNRLWGCKYGIVNGQVVNEIYGSALGDFKNWNQFLGLATDSWAASVGSDGQWTGAVNYLGNPVFFKENRIHEVGIDGGGAHQLHETICRGVQKGSHKSLVVVHETLLYKSRADVCAWQGGFPESISPQLGDVQYEEAVAGAYGKKYYISMKAAAISGASISGVSIAGTGSNWNLFVYDMEKGLWIREDDMQAQCFARVDSELYVIDGNNKLLALNGTEGTLEDSIDWYAETGVQSYEYPDQKYLSRYNVRMKMGQHATAKAYLQYNTSGAWVEKCSAISDQTSLGTITLPIRPQRCDHLSFKIGGSGYAELLSIARILEVGSDA